MRKRVAINISLPDAAFKEEVLRTSAWLQTDPSAEFVKLFKRLRNKKRDLSQTSND